MLAVLPGLQHGAQLLHPQNPRGLPGSAGSPPCPPTPSKAQSQAPLFQGNVPLRISVSRPCRASWGGRGFPTATGFWS